MAAPDPDEPTRLLRRAVGGDQASAEALFEVVYSELRKQAERVMSPERDDHTLQPTALVHEAFLRLVGMERIEVRSRDEFLSLAARAMHRVLVDHARARGREKRGNGRVQVTLSGERVADRPEAAGGDYDVVDLEGAYAKLEERSPRQAQVVELRFFGGLSNETIARILEVSLTTVEREWRAARAWLSVELRRGS